MQSKIKVSLTHVLILLAVTSFFVLQGASDGDEEKQIRLAMNGWKRAMISHNIDSLMLYYSDEYSDQEAEDKAGLKLLMIEAFASGMLDQMEINLESAELKLEKDRAEFIVFDEEGEPMMDFALQKEQDGVWRITGVPSEECSYDQYKTAYGDDCVQHEGFYRCWDIYIPEGLSGKVPLLIDIHGWTEDAKHQREISGFEALAKSERFIVVWPYGLCNSWNSGEACCPPASAAQHDDVGFIKKMVNRVVDTHPIDKKRIYATGLSNGCAMAQRLANEASDIFAAVAGMSLHLLVPEAAGYTPIPVMILMGTEDDLYEDGDLPGALANFETWKSMNGCTGKSVETWREGQSFALSYSNCKNDAPVTLVTINGGGHILYKGEDTEINTTDLAWKFMRKFSKN